MKTKLPFTGWGEEIYMYTFQKAWTISESTY